MEDKPSVDYIRTLAAGLEGKVYGTMRTEFNTWLEAYRLNFTVQRPKSAEVYIPPTAWRLVQEGSCQLVTDRPTVTLQAAAKTSEEQLSMSTMQDFAKFALLEWGALSDVEPFRECAVNVCLFGLFGLRGPTYSYDVWGIPGAKDLDPKNYGDYKKMREAVKHNIFPVSLRAMDPLTFLPDPSGRKAYCIEKYKRLAIDLHAMWPEWKGYNPEAPFQEYDYIEYSSRYWRCVLIDDMPVLKGEVQPNLHPYLPYDWYYSGWGRASANPEDRAVGLIKNVYSALKAEARQKTAYDHHIRANIYGQLRVRPGWKGILQMEPGGVTRGSEEDFGLMPQPRLNPDAYGILGITKQDITEGTYAEALSGKRAIGETSGYMKGLSVGQGRVRFRPPLERLEKAAATAIARSLLCCKYTINESVPFGIDQTLKPRDVIEPVFFRVNLEPVDPAENDRRIKQGLELLAARVISLRCMREEFAKRSDPQMRREIMVESVIHSPEIQGLLSQAAAEGWGLRKTVAELQGELDKGGMGGGIPLPGMAEGMRKSPEGIPMGKPGEVFGPNRELMTMGAMGGAEPPMSKYDMGQVDYGV